MIEPVLKLPDLASDITYIDEKITSRIVWQNENRKAILLAFSAGQELKEHITPVPATLIMLEGQCNFLLNGKTQILQAGEIIAIPVNEPHALIAEANFKMVLIK